jgi:hypothetical protein
MRAGWSKAPAQAGRFALGREAHSARGARVARAARGGSHTRSRRLVGAPL